MFVHLLFVSVVKLLVFEPCDKRLKMSHRTLSFVAFGSHSWRETSNVFSSVNISFASWMEIYEL